MLLKGKIECERKSIDDFDILDKHCRYQLDVFTRIISGKLEEMRQIIDVVKKFTLTIVFYLVSGDYFKEFGCVAGDTGEVAAAE